MRKYILVDINNTILDSRQRQCGDIFFVGLINKDKINYSVIRIIKMLLYKIALKPSS